MEKSIIKFLVETGVVGPDEIELYSYGISLLLKKIVHTVIILVIGAISGMFWCMLVFLLSYIAIREYSGGYHAKTRIGCCTCTVIVTISVVVMFNLFPEPDSIYFQILLLICAILIWFLSPQDTDNKPLEVEERYVYRKKTRKLLTISAIILLLCYANATIFLGIASAWIIQAVMLSMAMSKKLVTG